jgi:hypothetical protein
MCRVRVNPENGPTGSPGGRRSERRDRNAARGEFRGTAAAPRPVAASRTGAPSGDRAVSDSIHLHPDHRKIVLRNAGEPPNPTSAAGAAGGPVSLV